jgi:hypothetical protein
MPMEVQGVRKSIVLHIGAHKTGTTAIQRFCHLNRAALAQRGVLFPRSCAYHFSQHRLAFALRGTRPPGEQDKPEFETESRALIEEIAHSDCPTVFISSEELFALPKSAIERLRGVLGGHDVRVLAVLRRPDELFASIYNQMVKDPRNRFCKPHRAFIEHPEKLLPDLNFRDALQRWSDVFGPASLQIKCFEDFPDATALAAAAVGWDQEGLDVDRTRANVSVSVRTAELIRLGKQAGLIEPQLRRLLNLGEQVFGPSKAGESLLLPSERLHILRKADEATDFVFHNFVGADNVYSSRRFDESAFPAATVLGKPDLVKIVAELLSAPQPRAEAHA